MSLVLLIMLALLVQINLIINTGGINIDSTVGSEFKVTTNNAIVECVYVDSAKGWLVYINQAAGTTPSGALQVTK
jgi:adenine C2-methylase RlmN of 23S rRNA A2503 and tRNA A37